MKKLLYLVMAAIVLMACEKDGGKDVNLPDQDKKALEHLCSAAKFLNQTEDQLNKTFKEAGFKEYPYTPGEYAPGMEAPASDELTYVHYCYNAPDVAGWTGYIENEEQHKAYNQILKAGKVYINVVITYYNGKFYKIDGTFHVDSSIEGVNQIYLVASNIAYDVLPTSDDGYKNWSGGLGDLEAMRTDKPNTMTQTNALRLLPISPLVRLFLPMRLEVRKREIRTSSSITSRGLMNLLARKKRNT